jgi:hypothetical protein
MAFGALGDVWLKPYEFSHKVSQKRFSGKNGWVKR